MSAASTPPALAGQARWVTGIGGIAALVLGVLLITRPLSSLVVLSWYIGLSCLVTGAAEWTDGDRVSRWIAVGWMTLGLAVVAWLGRAIAILPLFLAGALVLGGLVRVITAWRRPSTWDERVADTLFGVTEVVFGLLALAWPDVTLIVVAVLFGIRMAIFGGRLVLGAVRSRRRSDKQRGLWARAGRTAGAVVMLALAVLALGLSGRLRSAVAIEGFYDTPEDLSASPGTLLDYETFQRGMPDPAKGRGWRILYATTREDGSPTVASALVVVPVTFEGEWPVIAWAHGTTGYARHCAPSMLEEPLASGAMMIEDRVIEAGWALVATDYTGLGTEGPHPYLIGEGEARSVLDAVRAARQLPAARIGARTVVWGHSQGGHAALWTGQIQPTYASDVPLLGVAALAPASDVVALSGDLDALTGGSVLASFVAAAYGGTYSDVEVDDYLFASARPLVREMATRCLSEPGVLVSVLTDLSMTRDRPMFARDPASGPLGAQLAVNVPSGVMDAPLLLAQGGADPLITRALQDGFVATIDGNGVELDYRVYEGMSHLDLVEPESPLIPELMEWTAARFRG